MRTLLDRPVVAWVVAAAVIAAALAPCPRAAAAATVAPADGTCAARTVCHSCSGGPTSCPRETVASSAIPDRRPDERPLFALPAAGSPVAALPALRDGAGPAFDRADLGAADPPLFLLHRSLLR